MSSSTIIETATALEEETTALAPPDMAGPAGDATQPERAEEPPPATRAEDGEPTSPKQAPGRTPTILKFLVLLLVAALGFAYLYRDQLGLAAKGEAASGGERKILYWVDPMHPSYISDEPGIAPDCGMDLVPVYADGAGAGASSLPPGAVLISAEKQQLIGVKTGHVEARGVNRTLRAVGKVAYDETKVSHVHARFEGWVESVDADFTGKFVTKGQKLLEIYSPELYATQQELLLARRSRDELKGNPYPSVSAGAESLYQAARRRLEQWDVPQSEIDEIERRGAPTRGLPVLAPASGFITSRNAYLKQRVMPDTDLYTIADLSTVWIIADVYEYEAADVHVGQRASVTVSAYPGRTFRGTVSYIYPELNAETRTLRVRVDVANASGELKPDMYADVAIGIASGTQLLVPEEAVMVSGGQQTVFVALEGGYFEPRAVTLGGRADGKYVVLSGLSAGERIVTSGNFLIDSESKLKSALAGMGAPGGHAGHGGAGPGGGSAPADHSQHQPAGAPAVDRSQHQSQPAGVDHSGHGAPAEPAAEPAAKPSAKPAPPAVDHSKMDHSQHESPKAETGHEGHAGHEGHGAAGGKP
jgi:RND family efflux transporter MFP subunit